jgi:hypothetical protein
VADIVLGSQLLIIPFREKKVLVSVHQTPVAIHEVFADGMSVEWGNPSFYTEVAEKFR